TSPRCHPDHCRDQGAGNGLRRLAISLVAHVARAAHGRRLRLHPPRRQQRLAFGNQVVAAEAVGDVDDVALLADVLDVGAEDNFHSASSAAGTSMSSRSTASTTGTSSSSATTSTS